MPRDGKRRRRRRLAPRAAGGTESPSAAAWASLHEDLVQLIAWRVLATGDLRDYVRLRAACSQWRSSAATPRGGGVRDRRFHPRRWMMFPEGHGLFPGHPCLGGRARFLNLSTGELVRARLPLFSRGFAHVALDSADGLLVLYRRRDAAVLLLNPFTGDVAELPPLASLFPLAAEPRRHWERAGESAWLANTLSRVSATCVSVSAAGDITVMLALRSSSSYRDRLIVYATAGDRQWNRAAGDEFRGLHWQWALPSQGKIYATRYLEEESSGGGRDLTGVYRIDPPRRAAEGSPSLEKIAECPPEASSFRLVECGPELLLVGETTGSSSSIRMAVYRLADLVAGKIAPVTDIGGHALFLGERSLCVLSSNNFPSILGNSIICWLDRLDLDKLRRDHHHHNNIDMKARELVAQYDMVTGAWSRAIDGHITRPGPSPSSLIHHIYTCCFQSYW
ncbi:unnamed protein product [Urochloa humidicola]